MGWSMECRAGGKDRGKLWTWNQWAATAAMSLAGMKHQDAEEESWGIALLYSVLCRLV